jgi:circadian clock protein KaiB
MSPRKTYILKLYVAGNTPNSMRALKTLRNILDEEFRGVYALKVIDVLKNPQLAEEDKILATPTLAKILPPPVRRIIGDLSDRERVLIGLDLLYDELSEESMFEIDDEVVHDDLAKNSTDIYGYDSANNSANDSPDRSTDSSAGNSANDSVDDSANGSVKGKIDNLTAAPARNSAGDLAADTPGQKATKPAAKTADTAANDTAR